MKSCLQYCLSYNVYKPVLELRAQVSQFVSLTLNSVDAFVKLNDTFDVIVFGSSASAAARLRSFSMSNVKKSFFAKMLST